MCRENLTFRCCALQLIVVSLVSQSSSTSADKNNENSTVQCKLDGNAKRNCNEKVELAWNNLHKNAIKHNDMLYKFGQFMKNYSDDVDSMQYESSTHFVNYLKKDDQIDIRANFTKIDSTNDSNNKNDNKHHNVSYEMCENITCIKLCCPLGNRLVDEDCIAGENIYVFPNVYGYSNDSLQSKNKTVDELFQLTVRPPCQKIKHVLLNTNESGKYKKYMFYTNGSLYLPDLNLFVEPTSYCLAVVDHNQFDAIICSKSVDKIIDEKIEIILNGPNYFIKEKLSNFIILYLSCNIISMLCTLIITWVYYILPELRNIHSFMLRRVSSLQFMGDMITLLSNIFDAKRIHSICVINALITYFSFMASFFWLTVMSFDMWRTFRELLPLRSSLEQQEKKKLRYSIFAWGFPFILTIICIIMEFVSNVPENFRPEFGVETCWFSSATLANRLYFYGPKTICIYSSMGFSKHTEWIIARCEKSFKRHLNTSEGRRYIQKKEWVALQRKLNIMLVIISSIEWIVYKAKDYWLDDYDTFVYMIYSLYIMNTMENIISLLTFVCKKRIIRMLLKYSRLCQNCEIAFRILTRDCYSLEKHHHVRNNFSMEEYYQVHESAL